MRPRQLVLASSLAFALACAPVAMSVVYAEPAEETTVEAEGTLPEPADYDKADFYEEAPAAAARTVASSRTSSLSPVDVSAEMKYFTKYESHANYRQGFGYGDGYNALGYYQFDRRYSLISFLTAVYNYNPTKYSMFEDVLARRSEVSSSSVSMYDSKTRKLTELGQMVQDAWYAAYDADPAEFSALQDSYAYNSYYVPTERWLKSQGIDISGRADCVKGMVWGLSNMWGVSGVQKVLLGANLSNDMTDREFVTALSQQITDHIENYSSQTEYYAGWKRRYRNELTDCLKYIAEDEAAAAEEENPAPEPEPETPEASEPETPETPGDAGGQGSAADEGGSSDAGEQGSGAGPGAGSSDADDSAGNGNADSGDDASSEDASGDTGDDATDADSSDAAGDSSSDTSPAPSRPNRVPPSNAVSGGTAASKPNNAPSNSTTATDGVTSSDDESGETASDDSTSGPTSTSTSEEKGEDTSEATAKKEGEEESGEKSGSKTSGAQKQTEQAKKAGESSSESGVAGSDDADVHPNGVMPQTSDLIMFTCFASASAACFGATFVYAGKRGLKKSEDDEDNEDNEE